MSDLSLNTTFILLAMIAVMRIVDQQELAKQVKVNLPKVEASARPSTGGGGISLVISQAGEIRLNGRTLELRELGESVPEGASVSVLVDDRAPSGRLVAVQDVLARRSVREVGIAVQEEAPR